MVQTTRWTTKIEKMTAAFVGTFGELTEEEINWKPAPHTWSIAQNMDHLIVINKTYFPIFKNLQDGTNKTTWLARIPFIVDPLGKFILRSVQPDRRKKMKTFSIWEPTSERLHSIVSDFEIHQRDLLNWVSSFSNLISDHIVIASPANRLIVYKLETAFDIIVAHEQRHFEQARDVLAQLPRR